MEHCSEIVEATCFLLDRLGSWRLCYYSDTLDNFCHFQIRPHSTSCWVVTFGKGENNGRGFWEVNLSLKFKNRFFLGYCVKWKYILRQLLRAFHVRNAIFQFFFVFCLFQNLYVVSISKLPHNFFFCVGFLSWTFTNHRTAGEGGGGHFFNSSLPLPPASQTLRH